MTPRDGFTLPSRRDPTVARIARAWRALTSGKRRRSGRRLGAGERTLVACSGGADSSSLVLALAAVTRRIVVAHVVHDMRERAAALKDRDAAAELAERLGLEFVEAEVSVRSDAGPPDVARDERGGRAATNIEHVARQRRYDALVRLARGLGISYVATAHHAQDQLETILMRLARGAGLEGLRGIAPRRRMSATGTGTDAGVWLIRPMLGVTREDAEAICRSCGWKWREDATNRDTSRLRGAIRARVVPELLAISPRAAERAGAAASMLRDAAGLVRAQAGEASREARIGFQSDGTAPINVPVGVTAWTRERLASERLIVLGEMIRREVGGLRAGAGKDSLRHESVAAVARAIRDSCRDPRRFNLAGIQISVMPDRVEMRRI